MTRYINDRFRFQWLNQLFWRQHLCNQQALRCLAAQAGHASEHNDIGRGKPQLLVVVPYDVSENVTGGSARVWGLCRGLAA